MNPAARVAVGFLSVVLFVLTTVVVVMPFRVDDPSPAWLAPFPGGGAHRVITATPDGGVAQRAGLRVGDVIDLSALGPSDLAILRRGLAPHEIRVPAQRSGLSFVADLRFVAPLSPLPLWARVLTIAMNAVSLALILVILKGSASNRPGVRFLLGFIVANLADSVYYPQFAATGAWAIAGTALIAVSTPLMFYFLLRLLVAVPQRSSPFRPSLERLALPLAAAFAVSFAWVFATYFWPSLDVGLGGLSLTLRTQWFVELVLMAAIFAAIVDGLVYAERTDRVAMQWIASTVIVFIMVEATRAISFVIAGSSPGWLETIAFPIETVVVLGAAYAVLRHRLIDLEFVFSRAAVFAAVSAVVVTIFVAAEWIIATLGDKLLAVSHPGVAVERFSGLLAALVAGLLARPVHGMVDRLLNRVFFARQHCDEEALRRFAREAEVATDPAELLASAFEVARKHVEGSFVSIFVRNGAAYRCLHTTRSPASVAISENDPVALRLRRFGEPFELNDGEHEFQHAMFFPMTVLGRLVAFVVCGPKVDRTHYGEREIETISQFAHRVGTAYAWLDQAAVRNSIRKIAST